MTASKLIISPKTRVGELLDNYPELEFVLMEMSPAFEKLRNPVLRKTVARVATLQQVAVVGGLNVDEIVNSLRSAAGLELTTPFIPAPIIDMLRAKEFNIYSIQKDSHVLSYIVR